MQFDASGDRLESRDMDDETRELLREYRLFQYDLSVGQRYSEDAMFPQAAAAAP
jgi:hypothetical protein